MDYYQIMVNKFNPECNVAVSSSLSNDNNTTTTTTNAKENQKYSILVSAGSRSTSIPSNLTDKAVSNRALSLFNNNANNNNCST